MGQGKQLTARQINSLPAGMHGDRDGLYLQVAPSGSRSWIFRYSSPTTGKRREMGLGPANLLSLAEARERAGELRKKVVLDGIDPIEEKRLNRANMELIAASKKTFKDAALEYIEINRASWSNEKHAAQWTATLEAYAFPIIGDKAVGELSASNILDVLTPIWSAKAETAARLRGRIEMILDFGRVQGWRDGENPARWKGNLAHALPSRAKIAPPGQHESMDWREIKDFWPRLQVAEGLGGKALQFAILTACRSGEVLNAVWPEIDIENGVWVIPAERMKARQEHRVPLSRPAAALLRALRTIRRADDGFVFPGTKKKIDPYLIWRWK
jgi:integrase